MLLSTAYLDEAERCDEVVLLHEGAAARPGPAGEFSEPTDGRTFAVTAPDIGSKRALQSAPGQAPGVLDAVIQGEHVRVVLDGRRRRDPPS